MKQVLVIICLLGSINCIAQTGNKPIILNKDQLITAITTSSQEADMGMGMLMKNNSTYTNLLSVIDVNDKDYKLSNTITKLSFSMDFMGKETTFNSDKEEDRNSETGKAISEKLGKTDTVFLDKSTGKTTTTKKEDAPSDESDPLQTMMNAFGTKAETTAVDGAFFLVPAGKRTGDSWTVTDSTKEIMSTKTYTLTAIDNNIATISLKENTDANNTVETQGMQVNVVMNTKTTGEIIVDMSNSSVKKRTTSSDITGTIEAMGQATPVTAKGTNVSVYTLSR